MSDILIIAGPTASGKSDFALSIAQEQGAVIINADSMQIYKEIPILTAQPDAAAQASVPHRLYSIVCVTDSCSVATWISHARKAIDAALAEGKTPILTGGTGMYLNALVGGLAVIPEINPMQRRKAIALLEDIGHEALHAELAKRDPVMASRLAPGDTQRMIRAWEVIEDTGMSLAEWQEKPPQTFYKKEQFKGWFLNPERDALYDKINRRFTSMMERGVMEEIEEVAKLNPDPTLPSMKAHGLPELLAYLRGEMTQEDAVAKAQQHTRNYAKRQITWFKNQMGWLDEVVK